MLHFSKRFSEFVHFIAISLQIFKHKGVNDGILQLSLKKNNFPKI